KEPHASAQESTEKARTESGEHRKGDSHKDAPRKGEHRKREHRNARHRENGRPGRRESVPAPVTRLDEVRPRRAGKLAHADGGAREHFRSFLSGPPRVKP